MFVVGAQCLKDVRLMVEPPAVQRGSQATLHCLYDLEGAPLYSVKWYRGQLEFYRYSPSETPVSKIFPFPGILVDVSTATFIKFWSSIEIALIVFLYKRRPQPTPRESDNQLWRRQFCGFINYLLVISYTKESGKFSFDKFF